MPGTCVATRGKKWFLFGKSQVKIEKYKQTLVYTSFLNLPANSVGSLSATWNHWMVLKHEEQ